MASKNYYSLREFVSVWGIFVFKHTLSRLWIAHAWHWINIVTLGRCITHGVCVWVRRCVSSTSLIQRAEYVLCRALHASTEELMWSGYVDRGTNWIGLTKSAWESVRVISTILWSTTNFSSKHLRLVATGRFTKALHAGKNTCATNSSKSWQVKLIEKVSSHGCTHCWICIFLSSDVVSSSLLVLLLESTDLLLFGLKICLESIILWF